MLAASEWRRPPTFNAETRQWEPAWPKVFLAAVWLPHNLGMPAHWVRIACRAGSNNEIALDDGSET